MHKMNIYLVFGLLSLLAAPAMSAAPTATERVVTMPPNQTESQQALDVLQQLLDAYAAGELAQAEALIDPKMIAYSRVVDAIREAGLTQKQLRVTLSDTRTLMTEDMAIIQTHWQKRFVSIPGQIASLKSDTCTFVMRRENALWKLSALSGENPFYASQR